MFNLLRVFLTGMLISFLGTLPLGSLNVAAMQIAVQENRKKAIQFSLGVAIVEVLYVRLSLKGMDWVISHQRLFYYMQWATVFLFLALAVSSFITARKKTGESKNILLNNKLHRFLLGVTMSAINPAQIPFWFLWSTYLLSTGVLLPEAFEFNIYTAGIGIGTLIGLDVFIFGGSWLVKKLKAGNRILNWIIVVVFLLSAIIQLYRVTRKSFSSQLKTTYIENKATGKLKEEI